MSLIVPEHDAQELLSLSLFMFQRHDEVTYAAACAVIVHVFLDECRKEVMSVRERDILGQTQ